MSVAYQIDMVEEFLQSYPSPSWKDVLCWNPKKHSVEDWSVFVNGPPEEFINAFRDTGQPTIRDYPHTELKEITPTEHINKILGIRGRVIACSDNEPYPYELAFYCKNCSETYFIKDGKKPKCTCNAPNIALQIDKSRILDSQVIKIQDLESSSNPARMTLRVIGKSQIWKVKPGQKIESLGFYRIDTTTEKKTNKIAFIKRFEAYCVSQLTTEEEEFKISKEDAERFRNDVDQPFFWEMLTGSISPHITGFSEVKEALALLIASTDTEFPLNCYLVGDPSVAKSLFLLYGAKLAHNGIYNSFAGATWPSLSAHAQQDQETGSWIIQPGALTLADLFCGDEMHTIAEEVAGKMNEAGEQKTISYMKGGQVGTLPARCAWFFASNSYYGDWRSDLDISENLKFLGKAREALISRFPLIFILTDTIHEENDRKIARQVIENNSERAIKKYYEDWEKDGNTYYGFKSLKKFFIWLRTLPVPEIPDEVNTKIENWYVDRRKAEDNRNRQIKARFLDKAIKITKLKARILGKAICDESDFDYAEKLLKKSMDSAAFVPETGEVDPNLINGNKSKAEIKKVEDKEEQFWKVFSRTLDASGGSWVHTKDLVAELTSEGWIDRDARRFIEAKNRAGEIIQKYGQNKWSKS